MVKRVLPEEFLREKKYDIGKIVAQGGMGVILDAREATTERTVAMKMVHGITLKKVLKGLADKASAQCSVLSAQNPAQSAPLTEHCELSTVN